MNSIIHRQQGLEVSLSNGTTIKNLPELDGNSCFLFLWGGKINVSPFNLAKHCFPGQIKHEAAFQDLDERMHTKKKICLFFLSFFLWGRNPDLVT
jgi:hypothetical protein